VPQASSDHIQRFLGEIERIQRERTEKDYWDHAKGLSDAVRAVRQRWRDWMHDEIIKLKYMANALLLMSDDGIVKGELTARLEMLDAIDNGLPEMLATLDMFTQGLEQHCPVDPAAIYYNFQRCLQVSNELMSELLSLRHWLDGMAAGVQRPQPPSAPRKMGFVPGN